MIYALLYQSDAVSSMSLSKLKSLIDTSVKNNVKKDITGLLIYRDNQFMQLLEGDKQTIKELYSTLLTDKRHSNLEVLFEQEITARNVSNWGCGFLDAHAEDIDNEYVDFIYNIATEEFNRDSKEIHNAILKFAIGD